MGRQLAYNRQARFGQKALFQCDRHNHAQTDIHNHLGVIQNHGRMHTRTDF